MVEVQEEPFGELTLVLLCESQDGCNCCCHHPVHLLIEEEGETLEVIDVQDESFGELRPINCSNACALNEC